MEILLIIMLVVLYLIPIINVEVKDCGDRDSAKKYGEEIADVALNRLYQAFGKKGIGNISSATLRS